MNTILISYDLMTPGQKYTRLRELVETYPDWCKPLESFYLVKTNATSLDVANHINQALDSNDKIITMNVTGDIFAYRGISDDVVRWMNAKL